MFKNMTFRKKLILAAGLMGILLLYTMGLAISRSGKVKVDIVVIPAESQVLVDNKTVGDSVYLTPGEHTFTAKSEGFKDDSLTIKVDAGTNLVELIPEPESEEAKSLISEDPKLQVAREAIGGRRANQAGLAREDVTPLIALLPVTEILGPFTIDYGPSQSRKNGVFLQISDSSPKGRQKALEWIRERGQDPTDLEIRYLDFTNPLEEYRN